MSTELTTETAVMEPPDLNRNADLRSRLMMLPVDQQRLVTAQYTESREAFREWLMSMLKEGVHYGYPPGCKPEIDDDGNMRVKDWKTGKYSIVPRSQWRAKPSLYEAGADLLVDLLAFRPAFVVDEVAWAMAGSVAGRMFFKCQLFNKIGGELVGEGIGAAVCDDVGKRNGQGLNLALKLAKKRAKVDAVKNTLGISDLFTQDLEDMEDGAAPPAPAADAPVTQPRADRVELKEIRSLSERWKRKNPQGGMTDEEWKEAWLTFLRRNGGPVSNAGNVGAWNREHVRALDNFLKTEGV